MQLREFSSIEQQEIPLVWDLDGVGCRYCIRNWKNCTHYGGGTPPYKWQSLEEQLSSFFEDVFQPSFLRHKGDLEKNPSGNSILYLTTSFRHARFKSGTILNQRMGHGKIKRMTTFPKDVYPDNKEVVVIPLFPYNLLQKELSDFDTASRHVIKCLDLILTSFKNLSLELHTFISSNIINVYSFMDGRSTFLHYFEQLGCSKWQFYDRIYDQNWNNTSYGHHIIPAFTPMLNEKLLDFHFSPGNATEQE